MGFCGEITIGIAGGSPGEMVSVGLGTIGSLGVAYFASEATKPPAPIFDIKAAVMDDNSLGFSELATRVQNEIPDATAKEIWDLLQTLDNEGQICYGLGTYYNLERVVTIVATKLAHNSAAEAPSETASEANDFDSVVEVELEDLPAVSDQQQY